MKRNKQEKLLEDEEESTSNKLSPFVSRLVCISHLTTVFSNSYRRLSAGRRQRRQDKKSEDTEIVQLITDTPPRLIPEILVNNEVPEATSSVDMKSYVGPADVVSKEVSSKSPDSSSNSVGKQMKKKKTFFDRLIKIVILPFRSREDFLPLAKLVSEENSTMPACDSTKFGKCCRIASINEVSSKQLIVCIHHWEEHISRIKRMKQAKKQKSYDISKKIDSIYTKEVVAKILESTELNHVTGIANTSNQCFALAVFQCLMVCPPFRKYVSSKKPERYLDHQLRLFVAKYQVKSAHISINTLLEILMPEREVKEQEDAVKFFDFFCDEYLDKKFLDSYGGERLCSKNCPFSSRFEMIQGNYIIIKYPENCENHGQIDFYTLLQSTVDQWISPNHKYCDVEGVVEHGSFKLPDVLVMTICPYYYENSKCYERKQHIVFSAEQDMKILSGANEPDIFALGGAVAYQPGSATKSSHYYAKLHLNDQVFIADDSYIKFLENGDNENTTAKPYLVFYYRKNTSGNILL